MNRPVIDTLVKNLYRHLDDDLFNWRESKESLQELVKTMECNRMHALHLIDSNFYDNKSIRVLDYGCGTGIYVLLLLLKGYPNVHGVDINQKFNKKILEKLDFNNASFNIIGDKLPFESNYFDVINSTTVLEHVENIEAYYQEAARVLKPGGVCFFHFPHRIQPYDTHSKTWFIHYFPKPIRRILWNIFSAQKNGESLNNYLYYRTVSTHKRVAKKYFSITENRTEERLKKIYFVNYKGNLKIRKMVFKLINLRFFSGFFLKIFSKLASVDLYLKK